VHYRKLMHFNTAKPLKRDGRCRSTWWCILQMFRENKETRKK